MESSEPRQDGRQRPGGLRDPALCAIREANHIMGRYGRHFAGKPRATRDLHLLGELGERLASVRERLVRLPDPAQQARVADRLRGMGEQRVLLAEEQAHIRAARQAATPRDRAAILAGRIDEQLALYRVHVAGHPRLSCRPGLIRRIIANLEEIQAEAADTGAPLGHGVQDAPGQHAMLDDGLASLRRELDMIEREHQGASTAERIAGLGGAANRIVQEYDLYFAGQDRATRDLARLGHLCDRMAEVEQQMVDLALRCHSEGVARSLEMVQICLELYEHEHALIRALQHTERLAHA